MKKILYATMAGELADALSGAEDSRLVSAAAGNRIFNA